VIIYRFFDYLCNAFYAGENIKAMKKLLLSFIFLFIGTLAFSQSLSLSIGGNALDPGATHQVICDPADEMVTEYIACTNNGSATISVKTKKIIHEGDTLTGTINSFCWGACFPPFVYESPSSIPIEPGATSNDFYAEYSPEDVPGISKITYVFFDENNRDDSVSVIVEWNASPAGIEQELLNQVNFSDAFPNPASNVIRINYNLPVEMAGASIVITNLLGAKVEEVPLNGLQGQLELPVNDMPNGIYFYSLNYRNNLAITKKLVVRH
jgi:hypothetical protein